MTNPHPTETMDTTPQPTLPAPEPGEVGEVVAALKVIEKMQQEWVLIGNDDDGTASPSLSMPISLRRFTVLRDALTRAATLLSQQAAPAPAVVPPSGYSYRYPDGIRFNDGKDVNGCRPSEVIPYWFSQPPAPAPVVVPVAVAERLPGEGDCDTEGRCWLLHVDKLGLLEWHFLNRYPSLDSYSYYGYTHWLPHHAIPLPQAHPCP
jgi:hypothetical protein